MKASWITRKKNQRLLKMSQQVKTTLVGTGLASVKFGRKVHRRLGHKLLIVLCVLVLITIVGFLMLLRELPSPRRLTAKNQFAVSTQIFDRNGNLLYEVYGQENRIPVKLHQVPKSMRDATIAIEDQRFYQHWGFDILGIARAAIKTLRGERLEGGSTITQQLVKNTLLTNERSLQRKFKELVLSIFTELLYSKEQILELYFNSISYGGPAVGVEAGARAYFNKSVDQLDLAEAALLAGLPQAPSRYSPFRSDPTVSKNRQAEVLRRMVAEKFITSQEAEAALAEPLQFALDAKDIRAPHFVFYVRDILVEKYGVETVERGGLRVTTTLDLNLQEVAQASLSAEVNKLARLRVSNGAALITKPNTGEILAMVGSKDYFNATASGQVNVTIAERQPGSSIKPIMYATAFQEKLLNPGTILIDTPVCFEVAGQPKYCPKNYDGSFHGAVSVRQSLGNSFNIPAVKSLYLIGLEKFIKQANRMGISSWVDPSRYGLSLTLGGGEVRMLDMAQAFGVLANEGVKVPLTPILKVEDYTGLVLEEINPHDRRRDLEELTQNPEETKRNGLERVMDREPAYLASHIMQDNRARQAAFGTRSELVIPNQVVSAKTGTTNNLKDNWTIGFTPEFLVATWVGNNDGSPMNQSLVSGVTGAAPIFNDLMSYVLRDQEPLWQIKPSNIKSAQVCPHGFPPQKNDDCQPKDTELYWTESSPSASRVKTENVWIDPTTGQPPPYGVVVEGLILEQHTIMEDPTTPTYCADCQVTVDEQGRPIYPETFIKVGVTPAANTRQPRPTAAQN